LPWAFAAQIQRADALAAHDEWHDHQGPEALPVEHLFSRVGSLLREVRVEERPLIQERKPRVAVVERQLEARDEMRRRHGAFGSHHPQRVLLLVVEEDRHPIERDDRTKRGGDGAEERVLRQVEDDGIVDGEQRSRSVRRNGQFVIEGGDLVAGPEALQLHPGARSKCSEQRGPDGVVSHWLDVKDRQMPEDVARGADEGDRALGAERNQVVIVRSAPTRPAIAHVAGDRDPTGVPVRSYCAADEVFAPEGERSDAALRWTRALGDERIRHTKRGGEIADKRSKEVGARGKRGAVEHGPEHLARPGWRFLIGGDGFWSSATGPCMRSQSRARSR
jgi:hypothetical protein